ncbi:MAG: hypothetical protein ACLQFW_02710 [Xanthobacteraceae bacterium]
MSRSATVQFFKCPSCDGLYQVVKVEAGPETIDGEIACRFAMRRLLPATANSF